MPTINWSEGSPSGSDSLGQGDDEIRSLKSAIRTGLDAEHLWPAAGGDAGVHRLGSARPFVGTQSLVSSSGTDGKLFVASDTSRLFGVGSGGTMLFGGAAVLINGTFPAIVPQRHYWAVEVGADTTGSNGSTTVNFPNSGFSGAPYIIISGVNTGVGIGPYIFTAEEKSATGFRASSFTASGAGLAFRPFNWISIGTRVL